MKLKFKITFSQIIATRYPFPSYFTDPPVGDNGLFGPPEGPYLHPRPNLPSRPDGPKSQKEDDLSPQLFTSGVNPTRLASESPEIFSLSKPRQVQQCSLPPPRVPTENFPSNFKYGCQRQPKNKSSWRSWRSSLGTTSSSNVLFCLFYGVWFLG